MKHAIELLMKQQDTLLEAIKACRDNQLKQELIRQKQEMKDAIILLRRCQEFRIGPKSRFTSLPDQRCPTPSSEYRVIEDFELDDPSIWQEVEIPNYHLRLKPQDVVIEN